MGGQPSNTKGRIMLISQAKKRRSSSMKAPVTYRYFTFKKNLAGKAVTVYLRSSNNGDSGKLSTPSMNADGSFMTENIRWHHGRSEYPTNVPERSKLKRVTPLSKLPWRTRRRLMDRLLSETIRATEVEIR